MIMPIETGSGFSSVWHRELARGDDRPETDVEDSA
jgi:hypothetical protein